MSKIAFYFVSFLILCLFANKINCECRFSIDQDKFVNPAFSWVIGKKTLKISNLNHGNVITLQESEKVNGFCATKFSSIKYYYGILLKSFNISLTCLGNDLQIWNENSYSYIDFQKFTCNDYDWTIFEVLESHPWCSSTADSYVLVAGPMQKVFGALCYNFQTVSLESVRYLASHENFKFNEENLLIQSPLELENIKFGSEFNNFRTTLGDKFFEQTIEDENLFAVAVYKDDNLLQTNAEKTIFSNYSNFLKIKWWHNLLHGNWERFLNAFEEQTKNVTYDVFMGISGAVRAPVYTDCHGTEFRELRYLENKGTVPAYIWSYLRAVNSDEEFVFIGYNSPYYDFFNSNEIVFCKDICGDIPWLKNIRSTFGSSALGITFCCRPEDVRNSTILSGFPKKYEFVIAAEDFFINTPVETEVDSIMNIPKKTEKFAWIINSSWETEEESQNEDYD